MSALTFASKSQNTEEWLQERKKYMGSSDAPAALGMSRWCSPQEVAAEKRLSRTSDHHPQPESPEMKRGHVLEPVVAALYEQATGSEVEICPSQIHPDHGWMAASPDRELIAENALLECKTHSAWTRNQYGEPGTDSVTDYEFVQVQHQMAVTGAERVDVAILFGEPQAMQILSDMLDGGNVSLEFAVKLAGQMEFAVFPVRRDDAFIATLIEAEGEFWHRYVEGDEIPVDYKTIAPRSGIRKATDEENDKASDMKSAWLALKRVEPMYEEFKATMQDAISDAEGIETVAGTLTWRKNKDTLTKKTDWEGLARELGAEYMTPEGLDELIQEHTKDVTRPGPRVFRVPTAWKKEL